MAGVSDKARFYLEQSVPELQEDLRKQIFSREEITSISKKRSDFEHILNARGSTPADYLRYAEYEMNINTLRTKRIRRLGVKSSNYTGARRIFFILDRGTRKFHGDLGIWMQYISFARAQKSYKKLEKILTSVLRMHPTKPQLWIYAASYAMETQADMGGARGYMQRGVRFCTKSKEMWVEYAKLEMIYLAKIEGRRKILGLDLDRSQQNKDMEVDDHDADELALPAITAEDTNPSLPSDDSLHETLLENLASTPALKGAIPIAIFDAAMKEFNNDAFTAELFFDMFTEFQNVTSTRQILDHVFGLLDTSAADSVPTLCCAFRLPIFGIDHNSADFPGALGKVLEGVKKALIQHPKSARSISERAIRALLPIVVSEDVDPAVSTVVQVSLQQYVRKLGDGDVLADIVKELVKEKKTIQAKRLGDTGAKLYADSEKLKSLHVEGAEA